VTGAAAAITGEERFGICVFCGSRFGSRDAFADAARDLGRAIGGQGWRLIYGGGDVGLMGTVARAALEAGGDVAGIIPQRLLDREVGKRDLTTLEITPTMFARKERMIETADAFVVLPGGLGTLDELLEVVTLRQLGYHGKPIVVVNLGGYWDPLIALVDRVVEHRFADPSARTLYRMVDAIEEVLPALGLGQPPAAPLRMARAE
jgi:uncharacterized protein (TIGR00730 family)